MASDGPLTDEKATATDDGAIATDDGASATEGGVPVPSQGNAPRRGAAGRPAKAPQPGDRAAGRGEGHARRQPLLRRRARAAGRGRERRAQHLEQASAEPFGDMRGRADTARQRGGRRRGHAAHEEVLALTAPQRVSPQAIRRRMFHVKHPFVIGKAACAEAVLSAGGSGGLASERKTDVAGMRAKAGSRPIERCDARGAGARGPVRRRRQPGRTTRSARAAQVRRRKP